MARGPNWLTPTDVTAVVAFLRERGTAIDVTDLGRHFGRSWSWANQACVRAKRDGLVVRYKDSVGIAGVDVRAGVERMPPPADRATRLERYLARDARTGFDVAAYFNLPRVADGIAMCDRLVADGRATHDPTDGTYHLVRKLVLIPGGR